MTAGLQFATFLIGFVMMLLAVWGLIWKLGVSLKSDLREEMKSLKHDHEQSVADANRRFETNAGETRGQLREIDQKIVTMGTQITTIMEGSIKDLQGRVQRLESGQDDWTKELRQRTHDLAARVDQLGFAIELIKAGHAGGAKA